MRKFRKLNESEKRNKFCSGTKSVPYLLEGARAEKTKKGWERKTKGGTYMVLALG